MIRQLPENASLEHLKGQAKSFLRSLREGDPSSILRTNDTAPYRLVDAQRVIAREYGFSSWAKLKRHVEGYESRRTAFFAALRAGDRILVRRLLEEDSSLSRSHDPTSFGAPPITVAVERQDRGLIDLVLEFGADVDARSDWWAGSFGALDFTDDDLSDYLIRKGATLTAHAASRLGRAADLRQILEANPDAVHQRGGDGQFPLHFAKSPEIVDILMEAGAAIDARDIDHEGTAAQWRIREIDVAKRLIELGATPDIFLAVALNDLEMVERIIQSDPEGVSRLATESGNPLIPQAPGQHIYAYTVGALSPLQVADMIGHQEVYRWLFEHADPSAKLMAACWKPDHSSAQKVIQDYPGVVSQLTPKELETLPLAAWNHRTEAVRLLLEIGLSPDFAGGEASTAVDRAAFHGFADVIEVILQFNPRLDVLNVHGGTPLTCCIYGSLHSWRKDGDFAKSVELLILAGAPRPQKALGSAEVNEVLARYGIEVG
jgi:ankyrin repeat protein